MYDYTITVPTHNWLFYQAWLTQNYVMPVYDYMVTPGDFPYSTMVVAFESKHTLERFRQRWAGTLSTDPESSLD